MKKEINAGTILTFKLGEFKGKAVRVVSVDFRSIITTDIYGAYSATVGYYIERKNIDTIFIINDESIKVF